MLYLFQKKWIFNLFQVQRVHQECAHERHANLGLFFDFMIFLVDGFFLNWKLDFFLQYVFSLMICYTESHNFAAAAVFSVVFELVLTNGVRQLTFARCLPTEQSDTVWVLPGNESSCNVNYGLTTHILAVMVVTSTFWAHFLTRWLRFLRYLHRIIWENASDFLFSIPWFWF